MELHVQINPKALRETLCIAQSMRDLLPLNVNMEGYVRNLQALINECDRHRPLGPDGKHGDRHTETCGCNGSGLELAKKVYRRVVGEDMPSTTENEITEELERTASGDVFYTYTCRNHATGSITRRRFRRSAMNPNTYTEVPTEGLDHTWYA